MTLLRALYEPGGQAGQAGHVCVCVCVCVCVFVCLCPRLVEIVAQFTRVSPGVSASKNINMNFSNLKRSLLDVSPDKQIIFHEKFCYLAEKCLKMAKNWLMYYVVNSRFFHGTLHCRNFLGFGAW